jgi:hypothetical protein
MTNPTYPVTGCGLPACRTCHPALIPDRPPGESVLSLLVGTLGLLLFVVAFGILLLVALAAWTCRPCSKGDAA